MSSSLKDELYGKTARTAALQWEFGFAHFSIKFREERKKYLDYMYFYDFKLWWWNCQPSSRQVKRRIQKSRQHKINVNAHPKSLYISPAESKSYGTGIEIWAGFGPVGDTEKKGSGPIMSNCWGCFFYVFRGKKN